MGAPIIEAVRGLLQYLNNSLSFKAEGSILSSTFPAPAPPHLLSESDEPNVENEHLGAMARKDLSKSADAFVEESRKLAVISFSYK